MNITGCTLEQAPEILDILNDAILHTTALYDYQPRTLEMMEAWFATKARGSFPVLGLFEEDGSLAGFASYGTFRAWPAYKYTVEHSVYIHRDKRGRGLGRTLLTALIETAKAQDNHMMIGGIDSANAGSVQLHLKLGFAKCASIRQAGYKFGRWLDLEFYQLILPTPATPTEE